MEKEVSEAYGKRSQWSLWLKKSVKPMAKEVSEAYG